MSEPFEYAIKKDVKNNPIVRQVDEARHREQWRSVAVGAVVVVALLFWALQRTELLHHGYETGAQQRTVAQLVDEGRQLRLEVATLRSVERIERIAMEQLRMVAPTRDDATIIERVVAPAPPSQSVVARR